MANNLPPDLGHLEARLGVEDGSLTGVDRGRAVSALEDATVLALTEVTTELGARWRADAPDVVFLVILKAARREYENPSGYNTESLGEHAVGISETSGVYLTAREIAQIRRASSGRRAGFVGSVRTPSPYGLPW